jgi:AraC-like DNA-binding protein
MITLGNIDSMVADALCRGIAVGTLCIIGLSIWLSAAAQQHRLIALLACLSAAAWAITESPAIPQNRAIFLPILLLAFPVAGLFWLFVRTTFEDRRLSQAYFLVPAFFVLAGITILATHGPEQNALFIAFNAGSGLLCLHALYIVAKGWKNDLVQTRRRLRSGTLGIAALFSAFQVTTGLLDRLQIYRTQFLTIRGVEGAGLFALLTLALGVFFLRARPDLLEIPKPQKADGDSGSEQADRAIQMRLDALSAGGALLRENMTVGILAGELGIPEHRLRSLINGRMGYRNFADFLNSRRIEVAKLRLSDPDQAGTTVAEIAFELGYGSLSPFNRAFRSVTGRTPTQWRRDQLRDASNSKKSD